MSPTLEMLKVRRPTPAKIDNALRRRLFEATLRRTRPDAHPGIEDIGLAYGGWALPTEQMQPGWTAYCVGAGGDVSTDLQLRSRWQMTVRCIEPVQVYCDHARQQAGDDPDYTVRQAAVTTTDGPISMKVNPHPGAQSVSAAGLYLGEQAVEVDGRTLPTLMAEFGDDRIDLLKLDIEGAEYDVLPTLDLRALGVRVFATQLHHNGGIRRARALLTLLEDQGYRLVGHREVVKLTFLLQD